MGSKSAKMFETSEDFSYAMIAANNQTESVLLGSGNESCIQANRKVVKDLRPPQNHGDDQRSSCHHDEMAGNDFTMVDSDCLIEETTRAIAKHYIKQPNTIEGQHDRVDLTPKSDSPSTQLNTERR